MKVRKFDRPLSEAEEMLLGFLAERGFKARQTSSFICAQIMDEPVRFIYVKIVGHDIHLTTITNCGDKTPGSLFQEEAAQIDMNNPNAFTHLLDKIEQWKTPSNAIFL